MESANVLMGSYDGLVAPPPFSSVGEWATASEERTLMRITGSKCVPFQQQSEWFRSSR